MGVQGLWSLVGPAARPTQLESLRQKKIAVDASIWIHQFMRTMRDKEGNALRNGHLLGFFRRLCKLLFFDIKPIFVFDGGAPSLKRTTITERRKRREGVKVNLRATARKILSAQVKSRVLLEEEKKLRRETLGREDENYIYVDELEKTAQVLCKLRKTDQYELPEITKDDSSRLNKLDPRLATKEEIRSFVDEFAPTDLDIDSDTFQSLPPEIQYEVIQDLKNKSRQTSWARLDEMVKGSSTALDFSKHQIKLLKHRNTMTQRLMQMNTMAGGISDVKPARIAGERGRQYILYKNEDINEGLGWKLPGLSATEPVVLDPANHPEPKLEVPGQSDSPEPAEKEDKVKAAMANNPKLAAMFADFLSDGEEEDKREDQILDKVMEAEEQPLFVNSNQEVYNEIGEPDLINDMRAYMDDDDDAINQAIYRMYGTDSSQLDTSLSTQESDTDNILSLSADDFLDFWVSSMPDAFIYLHSLNDEHGKILKAAMNQQDDSNLHRELKSVRKQFGKTNERDEMTLESLYFHKRFLESVIDWKWRNSELVNSQKSFDGEFEQVISGNSLPQPLPQPFYEPINDPMQQSGASSPLVIDDGDDKENIQFVDALIRNDKEKDIIMDDDEDEDIQFLDRSDISMKEVERSAVVDKNVGSSSQQHVHVNIHQSLLRDGSQRNTEKNVYNNEDIPAVNKPEVKENETEQYHHTVEEDKGNTAEEESVPNKLDVEPESLAAEEPAVLENRGYNSEDELNENSHGENDEYARFVSDIASKHLDDVRTELYQDMKELNKQQRKEMGNSDDITDQMIQDIQELLRLFGVPYIVSPMEAEAQCAELESLALIDGTITDDSDVFLFGASHVYKNMFNQQRFVECYLSQDIEREMLLNRRNLIQLAFLLGSDYTDGIPGVGPVAAMEILSEFSNKEKEESLEAPLERFKVWYNSGIDGTSFQRKFRKGHKDMDIPLDFPNPLVKEAYYSPTVDKSTQKFEWGQPQLDSLRIFLQEAFGWTEEKADQVLLPVLREMNSKKATGEQQVLGSFFNVSNTVSSSAGGGGNHQHSSKRVQSIVEKWRKQKKQKTGKDDAK